MYQHTIVHTTATATYWDTVPKFSDTVVLDAGAADIGVSFCTISWTRTVPTGLREDKATCTLAIAKDPGNNLYSLIIDADKATAEGHLDTWWTTQKTNTANQWTLNEYRWHDWHADEATLGPADRVTARSVAGSAGTSSRLPDQDAFAMTFTTAARRHWGRVYLPGIALAQYDMNMGRFASAGVDTIVGAFHTFLSNLAASDLELVVASRKHQAILELSTLQSDDIVDIVRRRRAKQANYHKIYTS